MDTFEIFLISVLIALPSDLSKVETNQKSGPESKIESIASSRLSSLDNFAEREILLNRKLKKKSWKKAKDLDFKSEISTLQLKRGQRHCQIRYKSREENGKLPEKEAIIIAQKLTEKSDVYSFGVVLLKIITGRPVLAGGAERNIHVRQWVSSLLANGNIKNFVDPRLGGDFDINSVWKAVVMLVSPYQVEIAMACTTPISAGRPTMHQVVTELNECLATETTDKRKGHSGSEPIASIEMMTESTPLAR
uniref:Serine-threonine/tyrosine-protein kinase catalytic domain-containing protein n=1 Tax=Manihot esculenta TaxID=3983 RepID=A0A2C9VEB8_MANES